jgi:hypothetical protein
MQGPLAGDARPRGHRIHISRVSELRHIISPAHESSAPLIKVGIAIVDCGRAANKALLVVQNAIGDMPIDAKLRHPSDRGAPEPLARNPLPLPRAHDHCAMAVDDPVAIHRHAERPAARSLHRRARHRPRSSA